MGSKEYRPRLNEEEYKLVLALRDGWNPLSGKMPEISLTPTPAKILLLDVETAPLRSFTWGLWQQNVAPIQIISDWFMLTWSAKWLFEEEIFSDRLQSKEAIEQDDKRISKSIWTLVDKADIIIAHNANKFDMKRLNTRFLLNDLNPPMPYQVIDTLDHARKRFAISSNRLDYINKQLGIPGKISTSFELWIGCMKGDVSSLKEMEEYNKRDVKILEETYLKLRAWIKPHPNIGLFIEEDVTACPTCGSEDIVFSNKPYATTANLYDQFRCSNCGSVGRDKKPIKGSNSKTRSVPR